MTSRETDKVTSELTNSAYNEFRKELREEVKRRTGNDIPDFRSHKRCIYSRTVIQMTDDDPQIPVVVVCDYLQELGVI